MKVLFVSPEVAPLARTGGLGDVVGSLPPALVKLGADVRVVCPYHRCCQPFSSSLLSKTFKTTLGAQIFNGRFRETRLPGSEVPVYMLDLPELFDRAGIYGDDHGEFPDNSLRAFALCSCALAVEQVVGWRPDVIHAHDWMAASTPAYVNAQNSKRSKRAKIRTMLSIHNLQYQGSFPIDQFAKSGLPRSFLGSDGFEHYGSLNLLKGGIQHADKITTVSPSYAKEIRTEEYGCGLESCLNYRGADLLGILNGIDVENWDPRKDGALARPINPDRPKNGKDACKSALLDEFKLNPSLQNPLFGVVSRLCNQKGLDLLVEILPQIMAETHASFVILGSGDSGEESAFARLASSFPDRIACRIGFEDDLARRIFSAADFFVMPSRFEPCGLAQMYAMRYGALPIARKTGGLADTVRAFDQRNPNGFTFSDSMPKDLWKAILQSLETFADTRKFNQLRKNAFAHPCSWEESAEKYLNSYGWLVN